MFEGGTLVTPEVSGPIFRNSTTLILDTGLSFLGIGCSAASSVRCAILAGMGRWRRTAAVAAAMTTVAALAAGCSSGGGSGADTIVNSLPTNFGPAEKTTLNVGVVPAMDSAGFFVALHEGLFAKEGLTINYSPAASSETAIGEQVAAHPTLDISAGNYVSYIEAAA